MNLVFLGPAGSGKGTQAKNLEREFGVVQISTGDLLRDAVAQGTELGRKADPIMREGRLVPDDLVIRLIEERLEKKDAASFLLDGFPRTLPQAQALDAMLERHGKKLDRVLSLEVPDELLVERITGRRQCPKCGAVYHVVSAPPKRAGFCDRDDTGLIQRSDDSPEKLAKRLEVYRAEIPKVKEHYARKGLLAEIHAVGTPEGIHVEIRRALGK